MRRVRINTGKIGLVFKRGDYQRVIKAGTHWLGWKESVQIYDLSADFNPGQMLQVYLKDEALKQELTLVDVADHEIALRFEHGNFMAVLTPGRYAYWKGWVENTFIKADLSKVEITEPISREVFRRAYLLSYIRALNVGPNEKGILFIDGKFQRILSEGDYVFWKNSTPVHVVKTDMRQLQMEISGQEMLTKDKASLRLNFYAQYKVTDVEKALVENKEFDKQLYVLMQLALREFIGTLTLDELLANKDAVADYVINSIQDNASRLGVKVSACGIRDVILPGDMKEIMNQVLIAEKKAQANVITRREETASTRSLLNTAKLMEDNPMLFKLKEMEYTEKIAEKISSITLSGGNRVVDQLKTILTG